MTSCSEKGCTNRAEDGCIFKSIPKDPYKRALWVKRMNSVPPKNIFFLIVKLKLLVTLMSL
jgi:hypothetical protein